MTLIKNQGKSKKNKERVRVRKSKYIESDKTYYYIEKFNVAFSLYKVLKVALYLFKSFLEVAVKILVATKTSYHFGVTIVYFLEQESSLWFLTPQ